MQIRRVLKMGSVALVILGAGYLLGSGTISDVLNIGESKIGAGSTRADNEEYKAETERIEAEAARNRAEVQAEIDQAAKDYSDTMGSDLDPELVGN